MGRAWRAALLGSFAISCAAPAAPRNSLAARPLPVLHRGPATDYIASAGLRWMVVGSPEQVIADAGLYQELSRLFPPDRLDKFSQATGIDLRTTSEGLVAGYGYGTFYLAMANGPTRQIELKFRERLSTEPVLRRSDPRVVRISGLAGDVPETMVAVDQLLVGVAVGDPTPARVAAGYALGRLTRSPAALHGAALSGLPKALESARVRFYALGPFEREWQKGLHGLLGTATALGVAAEPKQHGKLVRLTAVLAGDWPNVPLAREKLEQAWKDLAESSLGRLVGLNQPASAAEFSANPELLTLSLVLEVRPLASGLEAAVAADVWKMMDFGSGPVPPRQAAPQNPAVP